MDLAYEYLWAAGYDLPPEHEQAKPAPVTKGHCPHCGKKIGRGLHFHMKACKERRT
jgi:hypothetical protein